MQWTAPSEKDDAVESLERNLRDAAEQVRANSCPRSQESAPYQNEVSDKSPVCKRI